MFAWVGAGFWGQLHAQHLPVQTPCPLVWDGSTDHLEIGKYTQVFVDAARRYTRQTIDTARFQPCAPGHINLSFNLNTNWLRFTIRNTHPTDSLLYLELGWPALGDVRFYTPDTMYQTGEFYPTRSRPIPAPNFVFPIRLKPNQEATYYFQIYSVAPNNYPLVLYRPAAYESNLLENYLLFVGFFAAIGIMLIYNLLLAISTRDRVYVPYLVYIVIILVFVASLRGFGYQFVWPDGSWLNAFTRVGMGAAGLVVLAQFCRMFLHTAENAPGWDRALKYSQYGSGLVVVLMLVAQQFHPVQQAADILVNVLAIVVPGLQFGAGVTTLRRGYKPAQYYLAAFTILIIGLIIFILSNLGLIDNNLFTEYAYLYGMILEQTLLSIALGDRINVAQEEKERFQEQAIAVLRENERLIQEQNRILEQKVDERTHQLKLANEELAATLDQVTVQARIIEKKNEDITESINYARRIQTAILPEVGFVRQYLPWFGVFYQPKDIVSGDFYWFTHRPDTQVSIFAAVDCTGHGVPGAFMSVIGYNLLNRIVNELKIVDPAEILTTLDVSVRQALKQTQDSVHKTQDGMDLSLCAYHHPTRTLTYAGANRPMYYLRAGASELEIIKGDKYAIGGSLVSDKVFTTQSLTVASGDKLFIFSDGIVDQFGGPDGRKKYTSKRLQATLLSLRDQPAAEVADRVAAEVLAWMGSAHQIDDLTFMAVDF